MPRGRTGTTKMGNEHKIRVDSFNASWADGNDYKAVAVTVAASGFNASWADGNDHALSFDGVDDYVFQCLVGGRERQIEDHVFLIHIVFQCLVGGRERPPSSHAHHRFHMVSMPRGRTGTTIYSPSRSVFMCCFNASWADGNDKVIPYAIVNGTSFNASWADGNDLAQCRGKRTFPGFNASWADGNDGRPSAPPLRHEKFQCLVGGRERRPVCGLHIDRD